MELTRKMAGAGADAVLVVTPSFYKNAMTDAALELHYRTVSTSGMTNTNKSLVRGTNDLLLRVCRLLTAVLCQLYCTMYPLTLVLNSLLKLSFDFHHMPILLVLRTAVEM